MVYCIDCNINNDNYRNFDSADIYRHNNTDIHIHNNTSYERDNNRRNLYSNNLATSNYLPSYGQSDVRSRPSYGAAFRKSICDGFCVFW